MPTPKPARTSNVLSGDSFTFVPDHPSEPGNEVEVAVMLGPDQGAQHFTISLVRLMPGASIAGHIHPFEESFFVLAGTPQVTIADKQFALVSQDFGLVPTAHGHAWSNPGPEPALLLRVHTPQPRPIGGRGQWGVFASPDTPVPTKGVPVVELNPTHNWVGHFDENDMAPPGSISMPGYHGANIQNVQIRMMVDELVGSVQHTMFVVQFKPTGKPGGAAKEHFHPFEEIYYLVSGSARTSFDGVNLDARAGDLIFAPVGASHGFSPVGTEPVRWIEVQAPLPPAAHGFTFHSDWAAFENLG
ncbi:cupin domain-containing protein [Pimelobacter simplex]|uniref:cupin domain-containing protein n=1 Tax=Nocardioides simplex TaxID=2045 RepID=UPI001933471E|nr:cupin domain-containing protein [Pimelobacter simplex]